VAAVVSRPSSLSLPGLLALALVSVLVVNGCTTLTSRLGVSAAEVEPPATPVAAVERPTPSPAPTPAAASAPPAAADAGGAAEAEPRAERKAKAKPKPKVVRYKPRPAAGPFRMNLYRKGDFAHQAHKDWCVAGSTLTMMNIMDSGKARQGQRLQQRLYERGRKLSPIKRKQGPIGVDLLGWAALLNTAGYGPYVVDGARTMRGAIRKAAKALRRTGRPVGLVTWRGAHSWVMSGFTATADPAYTGDFAVKAVNIQDTWYPYVSTIWGASRPPNTLVPVAALAEDYLPYRRPSHKWPRRDGRYMLILPVLPGNTVVR
jgi:hypothetical protein